MTSDFWLFLQPLHGRERHLNDTLERLDSFFASRNPPIDNDSSEVLLNTMEKLTSDLSLTNDHPFTTWSRDCYINKTWDLTCQYNRVGRYQKFNVLVYKYDKKDADMPTDVYLINNWVEWLPEKH